MIQTIMFSQRIIVETWHNGQEKVVFDIIKGTIDDPVDYYYFKFYPNGKIYKEGNYVDKKASGEWKFYYQNGNIKSIGNYRRGNMVGAFSGYYITGELEVKGFYQVGQLSYEELFNRDGSVKNRNENLVHLLSSNNEEWTPEQKTKVTIDCLMPMDGSYDKADEFCKCMTDSVAKQIDYQKFYQLSEYQRSLIFKQLMDEKGCCKDYFE